MTKQKLVPMSVRLAFREEGELWNVYLASSGTLLNAKHIGSIAMGAVKKDPAIKDDFMALMKRVLSNAIEEMTGDPPVEWTERSAPDSERSGSG